METDREDKFQNKRARRNDFEDYGHEMYKSSYEVDTFEEDMIK